MRKVLFALAVVAATPGHAAVTYTASLLQTPEGLAMQGFALNNHGDVVGGAGAGDAYQAYLRTSGGSYQALGGFGGTRSTAGSIADNGLIAGQARTGATGATSMPFIRHPGEALKQIPLPAGSGFALAEGITESGTVVGTYRPASLVGNAGFRWNEATGLETLTNVDGSATIVLSGINERGTTIGYYFNGDHNPFRWETNGDITLLERLGGVPTEYYSAFGDAINDSGTIAGGIYASGGDGAGGYVDTNLMAIWGSDGKIARTASFGADYGHALMAINSFGDTVGYTSLSSFDPITQTFVDHGFAVLWRAGEDPINLNDLLADKNLKLEGAFGINDNRQIVAYGSKNGVRFDVLLTPMPGSVPEPASWAMMIGGFAAAGLAVRRRKGSPRLAA